MRSDVEILLAKLGREVLTPQGIKLYSIADSGQCLFEHRTEGGLVEEGGTFVAYLMKNVQGHDFNYPIMFKRLMLAANRMQLRALEPYLRTALKNGAKNFTASLNDPEEIKRAIKEKKTLRKEMEESSVVSNG